MGGETESVAVPELEGLDDFFKTAFTRFQPDTVIATARAVPKGDGSKRPAPFAAIEVRDLGASMPAISRTLTDGTVGYFMANGLDRSVMHPYGGPLAKQCPIRQGERGAKLFSEAQRTPLAKYRAGAKRPPYFHASDDHVRELGFLWMDFDVGRPEQTTDARQWCDIKAGDLIGKIFAQSADVSEYPCGDPDGFKLFPWPSYVARSGRGVTALWMLVDESGGYGAPAASSENMHRWYAVEQNLYYRTRHWGADSQCMNPARWIKMPGSKVSTVDPRETPGGTLVVDYVIFAPGGAVRAYSLSEMTSFYGVNTELFRPWQKVTAAMYADGIRQLEAGEVKVLPVPDRVGQTAGLRRGKDRATKGRPWARWDAAASDIERLAQSRGVIRRGERRRKFAECLYRAIYARSIQEWSRDAPPEITDGELRSFADAEAFDQVRRFNERHCQPRLTTDEMREAVASAAVCQPKGATMAEALLVTTEEAETLCLRTIIPASTRRARDRVKDEAAGTREWRRRRCDEMLRAGHRTGEIRRETGLSDRAIRKRRRIGGGTF